MNNLFLSKPFFFRYIEHLMKVAKPYNMDQLMGENINKERQKCEITVPFKNLQYGMILQADEIEISVFRSRIKTIHHPHAFEQDRKCGRTHLLRFKGRSGLDIIAVSFPLPQREFIEISRCVFRNFQSVAGNRKVIFLEKGHILIPKARIGVLTWKN